MNAYNDGKAKAQKANKYDAKYNAVKPSVGIFGDAGALDWTGRGARAGWWCASRHAGRPGERAKANGLSQRPADVARRGRAQPKADQQPERCWGGAPKIDVNQAKKPEKKFFGLF